MELEQVQALASADQQVFLLGRIASETTRMDASLRFLHASLRGATSFDAFLDAPDRFAQNAIACIALITDDDSLEEPEKEALRASVAAARVAYRERNRFTHEMLREDLLGREWELAALRRPRAGIPEFESVTFDGMVALVLTLVACTWRLRGAAIYTYQRGWAGFALGEVEGEWDGSATSSRG